MESFPKKRQQRQGRLRETERDNVSSVRYLSGICGWLKLAGESFLDLCLPKICAGCEAVGIPGDGSWCADCLERLPRIHSPMCPLCGRPFTDSPDSHDHLCGECIQSAFHFDSARSAVFHSGTVRDRVHQFKFGARMEWVPPLVELLRIAYADSGFPVPDLIVPVPLHPHRLKQRGFNQSGLLAREFSRRTGLAVSFDTLERKNRTEPQTRLNRAERLKNVKGAFNVAPGADVKGRIVLLLDDVFTTGTTLSECAKTLKKKGASGVYALTITRALPD